MKNKEIEEILNELLELTRGTDAYQMVDILKQHFLNQPQQKEDIKEQYNQMMKKVVKEYTQPQQKEDD